jgi:Fibronectin type III domain
VSRSISRFLLIHVTSEMTFLLFLLRKLIHINPAVSCDKELNFFSTPTHILIFFSFSLSLVPSPVRELLARNVENTTVDLLWLPPEHFNGVLMNYKISINSIEVRWDAQNNITADKRIRYTWSGLEPYKYYEVYVCACTADCSNATQTSFTTAMGSPGQIKEQPISKSKKVSGIVSKQNMNALEWNEPEYKGGEMDFYEVEIIVLPINGAKKTIVSKVKSRECIFDMMCHNDTQSLTFRVRGVNFFLSPHQSKDSPGKGVHALIKGTEGSPIFCDVHDPVLKDSLEMVKKYDNHSQFFYGPWSPQNSIVCLYGNPADSYNIFVVMFLTMASILFVVVIFFLYQKIRDIKNIIVEFPPGLEELSIDKGMKKNKQNPLDVPDLLHNVDNNSLANEDEHKRLLRGSMNGSINGGDCSSVSDNTRSVTDQNDIEYQDFESTKQYDMHDDNIDGRLKVRKRKITRKYFHSSGKKFFNFKFVFLSWKFFFSLFRVSY